MRGQRLRSSAREETPKSRRQACVDIGVVRCHWCWCVLCGGCAQQQHAHKCPLRNFSRWLSVQNKYPHFTFTWLKQSCPPLRGAAKPRCIRVVFIFPCLSSSSNDSKCAVRMHLVIFQTGKNANVPTIKYNAHPHPEH